MPLQIQPRIIGPSAGDLEEARIRRLTDLAKLRSLEMAPEQEERLFRQRQAEFGKNTQLAERGLGLQERGQNLSYDADLLRDSTQRRGQDLGMQESGERNKTQIANTLFNLAADPNTNLEVLSEFARTKGEEGLAKSLEVVRGKELDTEVQKFLPALAVAKQAGDTEGYLAGLESAKARGPKFVERLRASAPEYATDLDPKKPGVQTKPSTVDPYASDPAFAEVNQRISQRDAEQKVRDEEQRRLDLARNKTRSRSFELQKRKEELGLVPFTPRGRF